MPLIRSNISWLLDICHVITWLFFWITEFTLCSLYLIDVYYSSHFIIWGTNASRVLRTVQRSESFQTSWTKSFDFMTSLERISVEESRDVKCTGEHLCGVWNIPLTWGFANTQSSGVGKRPEWDFSFHLFSSVWSCQPFAISRPQ